MISSRSQFRCTFQRRACLAGRITSMPVERITVADLIGVGAALQLDREPLAVGQIISTK